MIALKWKKGVFVKKKLREGYRLRLGEKEKAVLPQYTCLLEAIQKGVEDDRALIAYIVKKEKVEEAPASSELASFLIEYGEFIAEEPLAL